MRTNRSAKYCCFLTWVGKFNDFCQDCSVRHAYIPDLPLTYHFLQSLRIWFSKVDTSCRCPV